MNKIQELEKGVLLQSHEKYTEAEIVYKNILVCYPDCADTYNLLGLIYSNKGQNNQAEKHFLRSIELDSSRCDFHFNLGEVLRLTKDFKSAVESYEKALAIQNDFYEALINKSLCHKELNQLNQSTIDLKLAVKIQPKRLEAYYNLIPLLKQQGAHEEAEKHLNYCLTESPNDIDILMLKVENLFAKNDFLEIQKICTAKQSLEHELIYNTLGLLEKHKKNYNLALTHFQKSIDINPDCHQALNNISLLFKKTGKLTKAKAHLEKACQLSPNDSSYLYNLAGIYNILNEKVNALNCYQNVLKITPDFSPAQHMISAIKGEDSQKAPEKYIQTLFDVYASTFDQDLVENLEYKTPDLIVKLISQYSHHKHFDYLFDAGCGTGLCALACEDITTHRVGVDISPEMLKKAEDKCLYKQLITGDITHELAKSEFSYDLITASDVFVYLGDLSSFFSCVNEKLNQTGILAFSVETCEKHFCLQQSGRYAHSNKYIEDLAQKTGLKILKIYPCNLRKNLGSWIKGEIYLLSKV